MYKHGKKQIFVKSMLKASKSQIFTEIFQKMYKNGLLLQNMK